MKKYVVLGAALASLMLVTQAEARRHRHGGGAHCRLGQMYRPSIGICESMSSHRQTMREAARYERAPTRRELRRMSRRDRREYRAEMRAEARMPREEPSRLLPTRPYVETYRPAPIVYADNEAETQIAEAAQIAEAKMIAAMPQEAPPAAIAKAAVVEFAAIPWKVSGPFSLSPITRKTRFDWRP